MKIATKPECSECASLFARLGKHCVGFADTGGSTEKNLQPPTPALRFIALDFGEQCVGIWTLFSHGFLFLREV